MRITDKIEADILLLESIDWEHYGGWIGPDRRVHYVSDMGHSKWVRANIPDRDGAYPAAFLRGYVRFTHRTGYNPYQTMYLEGRKEDIAKTFSVWFPETRNFQSIEISTVLDSGSRWGDNFSYNLPDQRSEIARRFRSIPVSQQNPSPVAPAPEPQSSQSSQSPSQYINSDPYRRRITGPRRRSRPGQLRFSFD